MKKPLLIVLGIIFVVLLVINLAVKNPSFNTKQGLIGFAVGSKQYALAEETYKDLTALDSINPDNYYGHLVSHFNIPAETTTDHQVKKRDDTAIFSFYESKSRSADPYQRDIGLYGLGLYYSLQDFNDKALDYFAKVENRSFKYLNNSIGRIYFEKEQYELAEKYLLREIYSGGNTGGAYPNLIAVYFQTNALDKLGELLADKKDEYFTAADLTEYYFKTGKPLPYLKTIVATGISNMDLKSLAAAFLIMLVWLIYLRKIDLFEPEKWRYIILTFLLGGVFSYGTFILTDINNHFIGFRLSGGIFNDFMYCFLGIGLVEELMKLIPFLLLLRFTRVVNEPVDYIIYTSVSALGFAFSENIFYFHGYGLDIIHGRALIAVVIHMICSSVIGYGIYFGTGKMEMNQTQRVLLFLFIAAFCHGFFDFWLVNEEVSYLKFLSFFFAIIGLVTWNSLISNALNYSVSEDNKLQNLDGLKLKAYLIYGLSFILIFEYVMVSFKYGPGVGNECLTESVQSGAYLIVFISSSLSSFVIKRNAKWSANINRQTD